MDESRIREVLEVPGMETQEPATYPAPVRKKRRTAAMHAEDRMFILSKEIRELPGVCGAIMTPVPLKCPKCESIKMIVFEGEGIIPAVVYPDGSGTKEERFYPLEIRCGKCGKVVRQGGGAFL
jgi:phage FluMu protein Com